jgi:GMP synthase-like glutamine amidotransferase
MPALGRKRKAMSQAQMPVEDGTLDSIPSVRLDLVEKSACVWEAQLTVDLPKGYHLSVVLSEEKIIEATTSKPCGMTMGFHFEMSAESLSLSITDANGEAVLIDQGYLHLSNLWDRKYAHTEVRCETKTCHLCPCVIFMNDMRQLSDY